MPDEPKVRIVNPNNKNLPFQRKVRLNEEKRAKVGEDLAKLYADFDSNSTQFRSQLQRWVNNSEGVSEPSDFPFPGSSSIYKPITETRMNIVHSFFMSIIRPKMGRLFSCYTDNVKDKQEVKLAMDIAAFFNNHKEFNKMYVQSLAESFWATPRDGTVGRSVDWKKSIETRWETKTYEDPVEFIQKYPSPQMAGISEEEYASITEQLASGIPVSLDEEFDVVSYNGPWIETEEIKDVVAYPLNVSHQDRTVFLGKRFFLRASELKAREEDGLYENVDAVTRNKPESQKDNISQLQDQIEGVNEPTESKEYLIVHGRWYADLNGDGIEEKYLVTFAPQTKTVLQLDRYPFWHNKDFIQLEVFKRRPKRLLGRGIPQMLDDTNTEANIQSRFRIDSMAITNAPMLVADEVLKSRLDPAIPGNRIRPGGQWWLPSNMLDKWKVVEFPRKDFTNMLREETLLQASADSLIGASELRSGRETPADPRSPAQKTAILLNQSSIRMDDFIFDTIMGENEVLDMALRLYYQFGPEEMKAYVETEQGVEESKIPRSAFGKPSIHLQLSVTSLLDNPEYLRQQWEEIYMRYGMEPMIGNVLESRHTILSNIFQNRPETYGKQVLMPLQELLARQQQQPAPPPGAPAKPPAGAPQGAPNVA